MVTAKFLFDLIAVTLLVGGGVYNILGAKINKPNNVKGNKIVGWLLIILAIYFTSFHILLPVLIWKG